MGYFKKFIILLLILGVGFGLNFFIISQSFAESLPKPSSYSCNSKAVEGSISGEASAGILITNAQKTSDKTYKITLSWTCTGLETFDNSNIIGYTADPGKLTRTITKSNSQQISQDLPVPKSCKGTMTDTVQADPGSTINYQFKNFRYCWAKKNGILTKHYYRAIQSNGMNVPISAQGEPQPTNPTQPGTSGNTPGSGGQITSKDTVPELFGYQDCMQDHSKSCSICCEGTKGKLFWGLVTISSIAFIQCWMICEVDGVLFAILNGAINLLNLSLGIK